MSATCNRVTFGGVLKCKMLVPTILIGLVLGIGRTVIAYLLGEYTAEGSPTTWQMWFIGILIIGIVLVRYLYHHVVHRLSHYNTKELYKTLFKKWLGLDVETQDRYSAHMTSALNDTFSDVEDATDIFFKELILNAIILIVFVIGFVMLKPIYIPIMIAWIGINGVFLWLSIKSIANLAATYMKEYAEFNRNFQDLILNNWNIKYNNLDDFALQTVIDKFNQRIDRHMTLINRQLLYSKIVPVFLYSSLVALVLYIVFKESDKATKLYVVFMIMQSYNSYFDFWGNLFDLIHELQSIGPICRIVMHAPECQTGVELQGPVKSIVAKDVSFRYTGHDLVINGFNLEVNQGQVVAIMGSSGSGKSTTLHLLLNVLKPESGTVLYNGVVPGPKSLRNHVGIVPQRIKVFDNLSVKANIVLEQDIDDQKLLKIMKLTDLADELIDRNASDLSVGQKQRVLISRLLYRDPSVYVLDEYLSSVHRNLSLQIHRSVLSHIRRKGRIGIVVTHNREFSSLCDKIITIEPLVDKKNGFNSA